MSEQVLKFAKQYANQFKKIILRWYPLTEEILDKYLGKSYDSQILWNKASQNENIKWTKKFIEKYKNNLVWDNISANKKNSFYTIIIGRF